MKALLVLGILALSTSSVWAQETHYTSWGGFNGFSAGWSQRGFFADSGQLWDSGGLDFTATRSRTVRFGGGGLEARFGGDGTYLSAGAGLYFLESRTRDFDRYGYFTSRYDVSFGMGGRLRLGTSLGNQASLLLTSTWLPGMRGKNLPSRPLLSLGFGWSY